jgi:actin-related protein
MTNTLVCDCGAGSTSAVPVVEGYALSSRGCVRSSRGGDWIDTQIAKALKEKKIQLTLWYVRARGVAVWSV